MARRNYDKMFEENHKEEAVEEQLVKKEKNKKEEVVIDKPEQVKTEDNVAKVIGDANLNVRKNPGGEIITNIAPGTVVSIVGEANEDWFEISNPVPGFVMKKFIEV